MPTFCRHNRFIERCPICSKTLPGQASAPAAPPRKRQARAAAGAPARTARSRRPGGEDVRIRREGRAADDGYRSALAPGLRASADAYRLAEEIAFAGGRLLALATAPPGLYGQARADADLERASWTCFMTAYLGPLDGEDPFAGIRQALAAAPWSALPQGEDDPWTIDPPDLAGVPVGPRGSHDPARGAATLIAYRQWVRRAGRPEDDAAGTPTQAHALRGDASWTPARRFERLFERLALPGLSRAARYDLLVTLGRLGLYELRPDSLHLGGDTRGATGEDPATGAAKRLFGIADLLLLERRAQALAQAASVPIEALDLALANWGSGERATLGVPEDTRDDGAFERAGEALGL